MFFEKLSSLEEPYACQMRGGSAMLTYTLDMERQSQWIRSTPSELERRQPLWCTEAGCFYALGNFSTSRTSKDSYLLFYTFSGAGVVHQGGQDVRLEKGQALLMDCRSPQSYGTAQDRGHWYHWWAHVDGPAIAAMGEVLGLPRLVPVPLAASFAERHFTTILQELEKEGAAPMLHQDRAIYDIVATMAETAVQSEVQEMGTGPVEAARRLVELRYADDLTVEDMAREANVSPSYLMRIFKRQLGTSPHNYLLRYRITKARELLVETTEPVSRIARETGFSSDSNFSYRFRQMTGQSPREYRESSPLRAMDADTSIPED